MPLGLFCIFNTEFPLLRLPQDGSPEILKIVTSSSRQILAGRDLLRSLPRTGSGSRWHPSLTTRRGESTMTVSGMSLSHIVHLELISMTLTWTWPSIFFLAICGEANPATDHRIIGGKEASPNQFPWLVAIFADSWFCSGSLIGEEWVMTAAHCVDGSSRSAKNYTWWILLSKCFS